MSGDQEWDWPQTKGFLIDMDHSRVTAARVHAYACRRNDGQVREGVVPGLQVHSLRDSMDATSIKKPSPFVSLSVFSSIPAAAASGSAGEWMI